MAKKENTQSCFQRGLISLLILALLDQEDMYGYQIVQEITERSGGAIVTEEGSLYRYSISCRIRACFPAKRYW